MEIKENIQRNSPVSAKVSIEVAPEYVNERLEAYYKAVSKQAKIPGFRAGKIPPNVLKQHFGKEASSWTSENLVSDALRELIQKHDLKIVLPPNLLAVDDPTEGKSFNFEAEIDLKPEVPEVDCSNIEFEEPTKEEITDERIDKELEGAQQHSADYKELIAPRPAQKGDKVIVSYKGFSDGQEVASASVEKQELILGQNQVQEEFENAALGAEKGQTKEFSVKFDEGHRVEEVRGKTVDFKMTVQDVLRPELPELNDEFAKKIDPESSSLVELRQKVRKQLEEKAEAQYKKDLRERIGDKLVEAYPIEISPRQKKMTTEGMIREHIQNLFQMGVSEDQVKEKQQEIMAECMKAAEKQLKLAYILDKLAQQEDIKVTEEDINERIEKSAAAIGAPPEQVREYYNKKEEGSSTTPMERLRIDIQDEKSLDYALSKARMKGERSKS